jgi:hypothetical protein
MKIFSSFAFSLVGGWGAIEWERGGEVLNFQMGNKREFCGQTEDYLPTN